MEIEERVKSFKDDFRLVEREIGKVIVGQKEIIQGILLCLFAGGHVLLEGLPGLGKTLMVNTMSDALDLKFARIQFTPDLMPADIIGTNIVAEDEAGLKCFQFQRGPIFANVILADEVNRATPKTQSALLEAMQEHTVTVAGNTHILDEPFFVLATQNPIEMEGTFPLPEAQLDRFLFKLRVQYPSQEELLNILDRTTTNEIPKAEKILDAQRVMNMKWLIREVTVASHVKAYAVRLVFATRPETDISTDMVKKYVRYGSSPRGAQALILTAKVRALMDNRYNVAFEDIHAVVYHSLRHRMILNFEGEADGIDPDHIIDSILQEVPHQDA
ncbi:AAA domain-containing protein [Candidatus Poribacteria bacterium]|nr:AAA domain-containing protein [Candidatus Poribacteria bacterium]